MPDKNFIPLGKKIKDIEQPRTSGISKREDRMIFPSMFLDNNLGLSEKMVGKEMFALVKLKLTRLSKSANEREQRSSSEFDVMGINLKPKTPHYRTDNA